jgi:hypothetical protein
MITKSPILPFVLLILGALPSDAQHANDTLLFSIPLNESSASLYYCELGAAQGAMLAGPVIMADGALMFYSRNGYALYNLAGKPLDYHSLIRRNRRAIRRGRQPKLLAYPLDRRTLLYYRRREEGSDSVDVYRKRLHRRLMRRVKDPETIPPEVGRSHLFNLAHNTITNEMSYKAFVKPHLVGYTALDDGFRWWSIDKFYSFRSPLIVERQGAFVSFFPGLNGDENATVNTSLIEPLGVFSRDGSWYYYGVFNPAGSTKENYYQKLFLCDRAGNVLYMNSLIKNRLMDDVLAEVEEEKMVYTVKRAGRHAFLPAVDRHGVIYFGVIDYQQKRIDVFKRLFYRYEAHPFQSPSSALEKAIEYEGRCFCRQDTLAPVAGGAGTPVVPAMERVDEDARTHVLGEKGARREGYVAKIFREERPLLWKKLNRARRALPEAVQRMQDSLAALSTIRCPYGFALYKGGGEVRRFTYGPGEVVTCARVLQVTTTFEVFVRVDLVDRAEILVFDVDGGYLNRFVFNRQFHRERMDVVVISDERKVVEKDYEVEDAAHRFYEWRLTVETAEP